MGSPSRSGCSAGDRHRLQWSADARGRRCGHQRSHVLAGRTNERFANRATTNRAGESARSCARSENSDVTHDLMTPEKNVERIMWAGTIWFGVVAGSSALTLALLLSSGWRPAVLPPL